MVRILKSIPTEKNINPSSCQRPTTQLPIVEIKVVLNAESQKRRSTHVLRKREIKDNTPKNSVSFSANLLSQRHYHLNKQSKCHETLRKCYSYQSEVV